ncbi:Probable RNA-binding protein 46,Heterogeneous nuclear ribonucleoprotein R,Heterogeneous nuclear ribonucleoprotein Q,RNA-binding protein 47,APOBEC1 complementation factor [Lepeophtheirus salmonis]|uniref:Probable RNA-binding protein 46,Heterogeneous nuclear ribonucleoprotein R,Heterogeneous nuclear ribonucleoprotein Q,RNA-binding protein 47,APOBEC1 complementation factor n=1 Tax=Lepeophtheirus salmonis TaxID=72036 RepID=A0A7R8GZI0_LEPSM|nr:Probable RNA-binding protein 46,Heterogeneous nuclear ribonucleoprotein R,Heterogeneous nuclear ribonucleoprotein Q,RNA-binding protein 47,APOBEC1 complementation factor [Lepeophtheirus salmonis]CAF2753774.1 Probable RNA-binding protein 46,Heterogeneous nuclear ribonucleoprotein R,Heterogeneous nuclear ribonucleoprotein Q,RNA-binding protein 47,APOBEC1 complementation factor [Lepeophtheirus salmonis]
MYSGTEILLRQIWDSISPDDGQEKGKDFDVTPGGGVGVGGVSSSSSSSVSSLDLSPKEDFSLFNYNSLFTSKMEESTEVLTENHIHKPCSMSYLRNKSPERNYLMDSPLQRNGQRIYGSPPPDWTGPPPEKGAEIFVGKVPRDCFENELVPLFSSVGTIYELRLMMDFSGSNRGYLFVKYTNHSEARMAIKKLNNYEIRPGKHIGVCKSVDNRKLWISGLPKDRSVEEIKADLEKKNGRKSRSYAFVEYENHRAAALARRKLVPGRIFILDHEIEKVDWAQPEVEVEQEVMNKVQVLFVRNLSPLTSESKIGQLFEKLGGGKLERVKKSKDFAFIHFINRESAEIALSKAQHLFVDGCLLDVTWAKPVDKDIYNTRKELTKIFSTGSLSDGISSISSLNEFNPFRGAPGTTPPRSLVMKMLNARPSLRNKDVSSIDRLSPGSFADLGSRTDFFNQMYDLNTNGSSYYLDRPIHKSSSEQYLRYSGLSQNGGLYPYAYGFHPYPPFLGRYSAPPPYNSVMTLPSAHGIDPLSLSMYQMSLN